MTHIDYYLLRVAAAAVVTVTGAEIGTVNWNSGDDDDKKSKNVTSKSGVSDTLRT